MTKINYSPAALQDLEQIGDYIAEELKSPGAARNVLNGIINTVDKLANFPQMGSALSSRYEDLADYRYLVCGSYLTFYRIKDEVVYIDRILYGRQDYAKILINNKNSDNL